MARVNVDTQPTGPLPPTAGDGAPLGEDAVRRKAPLVATRETRATRKESRREPKPARVKPARTKPAAARTVERRYRQTIRKVDLWSVLKISVCFYLCGLVVMIAAGAVLWGIASGVGAVGKVESLIGELLGSEDFEFLSWRILRGATLLGLVGVVLMVVCTTLAAAFYNLFSEILGGIEVTVVEEEAGRR